MKLQCVNEIIMVVDILIGNNFLKYFYFLVEFWEEYRILKLWWMGDGLIEVWENQFDFFFWRDQCDEELRNGMKDKWVEKEKEVG